jgi:hypothetical protein
MLSLDKSVTPSPGQDEEREVFVFSAVPMVAERLALLIPPRQ